MKKILQLAAATVFLFSALESKAQLPAGSIAPNFTLVDINGVTQDLYTYLNAGKTVYIDVSATWCGPCWAYHNTGALENLWINHGPTGGTNVIAGTTNDVIVLFIEGDGTTTSADLHGTGTNTQGDWVTGVSHPIIDPANAQITSFNSSFQIRYFPTIYMICPDRSCTEVGQQATAALYAAKSSCTAATAAIDAEMMLNANAGLASCDSVTPIFRIGNVGTTALTSATITYKVDGVTQKTKSWTGSLATYANTTVTGVKVGSSTPGNHVITATISNPNGGADPNAANNNTTANFTIYPTVGGAAVVESFEAAGIPATWTAASSGSPTWDNATTGAASSGNSATLNWYNITSGQIDYLTMPPMSFAGAATVTMTFDVAHAQYAAEADKLEVQVSTNCGTTWTSKYNKSGATLATVPLQTSQFVPTLPTQWRNESVSLTTYAGQSSVLVRFKGTSAYGNDVYVDNVNFAIVTGIEENTAVNNIQVYPNPMTDNANVSFSITASNNVKIEMVNTLGQVVSTADLGKMNAGDHSYTLDAKELSNGLYFVNITVGNSVVTKKVSISK